MVTVENNDELNQLGKMIINESTKMIINESTKAFDSVNNPEHYTSTNIEPIDYIEDKQLGFCLGNVLKYISRAGRKHSNGKTDLDKEIEDLKKAKWYLERRIYELENNIL